MRVRANLRASFESMVRAPPLQDWASAAPGSVHKVAFSTLAGMSMPTLFGEVPLSESRKGSADGFVGSEWGRASRDPPREARGKRPMLRPWSRTARRRRGIFFSSYFLLISLFSPFLCFLFISVPIFCFHKTQVSAENSNRSADPSGRL